MLICLFVYNMLMLTTNKTRRMLTLTKRCSCVARIILLLSFSNCSPQPQRQHSEKTSHKCALALFLALLPALHTGGLSEKNCGQNYPTCLTFTDQMSSSKIAGGEDGKHETFCQFVAKGRRGEWSTGPLSTGECSTGPLSTCHWNLICEEDDINLTDI